MARAISTYPPQFTQRARRPSARGVASVEAAVALPFFALILSGLLYVQGVVVKKHALSMTARTCAWLYSEANCESMPPGCQDALGPPGVSVTGQSQRIHDRLKRDIDTASLSSKVVAVIVDCLDSTLDAAFGTSFDAVPHDTVVRPKLFGGGNLELTSRYHLGCNVKPQNPDDVVTNAWHVLNP